RRPGSPRSARRDSIPKNVPKVGSYKRYVAAQHIACKIQPGDKKLELRRYWEIVIGRWPVVLVTFVVVAIVAFVAALLVPQARAPYQATVSIAIRPAEQPRSDNFYGYDEYYSYVASEYLVDDLISIVEDHAFLDQVNQRIAKDNRPAPGGSLAGKKAHRVLQITTTAGTAQGALDL